MGSLVVVADFADDSGAEQWQLDAWINTYTPVAAGKVECVTDHVEQVSGHPARTVEEALAGKR